MIEQLRHETFAFLKRLYLCNKIGNYGAKVVAKGFFQNLTVLGLINNNIGDEGAKQLGCANFDKVQQLFLSKNELTKEGAIHLSKGNFQSLCFLNLDSNCVGVQGTKQLLNGKLQNITLGLWNNKVSEDLELQIQKFEIGPPGQKGIEVYF